MADRLAAEDWLNAALRALSIHGPSAVRAEALARDLRVTKGSFYWHFADMADFRGRLMKHWRELAYDRFIAAVEHLDDPAARLRLLARMAVTCGDPAIGGPGMEPAMRGWALAEPQVAETVAAVDSLRRVEIERLVLAAGACEGAGLPLYAAMLGLGAQRDLTDALRLAAMDALADMALSRPSGPS